MRIYLVVGHTGEYSDHTQWNVAAYPEREAAEMHMAKLKEELDKAKALPIGDEGRYNIKTPWDPGINFWDTEYVVEEVLLVRHVDEYLEQVPTEIDKS